MEANDRNSRRRAVGIGAATAALAATMITGGMVAAQTETTPPTTTSPGTTQTQPAVPGDQAFGGPNGGGRSHMGGGRGQGFGQGFGGQQGGRADVAGMGRGAVTVTTNDGTSLGLETTDGWARTIDTTGVVLTDDGATITVADVAVGDQVSIAQTRNADGSYTVTGIAVVPSTVVGTVASVGTDSFTVTLPDGTTQTVNVTAATTWRVSGSTAPAISDLTVGRAVAAQGSLAEDGSLDATKVVAR